MKIPESKSIYYWSAPRECCPLEKNADYIKAKDENWLKENMVSALTHSDGVESAVNCQEKCIQHRECQYFTYNRSKNAPVQ